MSPGARERAQSRTSQASEAEPRVSQKLTELTPMAHVANPLIELLERKWVARQACTLATLDDCGDF
eukprot:6424159-Amphidinium_carterae.1